LPDHVGRSLVSRESNHAIRLVLVQHFGVADWTGCSAKGVEIGDHFFMANVASFCPHNCHRVSTALASSHHKIDFKSTAHRSVHDVEQILRVAELPATADQDDFISHV
jgi:hypothetical protein